MDLGTSQVVAIGLAVLVPPIISYFKSTKWSKRTKLIVSWCFAVPLSLLASLAELDNYWMNELVNFFIAWGGITTSYQYFWEGIAKGKVEKFLRSVGVGPKEGG